VAAAARPALEGRAGDLPWLAVFGGGAALAVGYLLTVSLQSTTAFVLVVSVVALYEHDRRYGIVALFALWFAGPLMRRLFALETGFVENDPLSLAPFLATAAVAAIELVRIHVPTEIRRIFLVAAGGFALGLPVGLVNGPSSAVFAFIAYLAGVSGAALGLRERTSLQDSNLRRVLLYGVPPVAVYAVLQRVLPLPDWDREWLEATKFSTIGAGAADEEKVRVFASLNSPGTLAPLLSVSLLWYLTIARARVWTVLGAALLLVALSLTFVRGAWVALIVAAVAHVIASEGRSARLVFGSGAVAVAATLALAPVSSTARDVVTRFESIGGYRTDQSAEERSATFSQTLPVAATAPLGHGLGSAGEPSKLEGETTLRFPDNGYLSLMYQVGPAGFLMVLAAVALMMRAAWEGARARAPGQDLRVLVFAALVYYLVLLTLGDAFYGVNGVIFWFLGGQALAFQLRRRAAASALRRDQAAEREPALAG
jgi:hypothetical protein